MCARGVGGLWLGSCWAGTADEMSMEGTAEGGKTYDLLAIQLEVLLRWHFVTLGVIGVRRINAFSHIS